jgi:Protein of unknown function (DUF2442)
MGFEREFELANRRGAETRQKYPKAIAARYDYETGKILVTLRNGTVFPFSPQEAEGLEHASAAELERIEISASGFGIHFPELDADFSLPGLLDGRFGSKKWMAGRNTRER